MHTQSVSQGYCQQLHQNILRDFVYRQDETWRSREINWSSACSGAFDHSVIPLVVAENACWQEVFKLTKPSDYLLVSLGVNEICEWVMESVQEKKWTKYCDWHCPCCRWKPQWVEAVTCHQARTYRNTHTYATHICIHES